MMTHEGGDSSSTSTPLFDAQRKISLRDAVGELVPLRGWRLRRLCEAMTELVERELTNSGAHPKDAAARRIVERQQVQRLRDALAGEGPFSESRAALLAVRYEDRPAFEAYGRLHSRLTDPGTRVFGVRTLREMLLGLRLRLLCLEWETIALIFGAFDQPCDEAALRKRHSRLASLAAGTAGAVDDWRVIDAYLKAKGRSFGGSRRRFPLGPLVAMLASVGVLALAVEWHRFAPEEAHPPAVSPPLVPTQPVMEAPIAAAPTPPLPTLRLSEPDLASPTQWSASQRDSYDLASGARTSLADRTPAPPPSPSPDHSDASPAQAGSVEAGASQLIAYFDVKRVIQEVDDAAAKRRVIEAERREKQKQLDALKADLEQAQRDYDSKKAALSPAAREQIEADIAHRAAKAQTTFQALQLEISTKEQEALNELLTRLQPVVAETASSEGYSFVFEKNEAGLFFAPKGPELTSELIRRYNQRYPVKQK